MKDDLYFVLKIFLSWRVLLFLVAYLSAFILTKFGGAFPYWVELLLSTKLPNFIWGFGNFDGVHYLRIAMDGYSNQYTQAFFPVFPILIKLFAINNLYFYSGLIIANICGFFTFFLTYKLYRFDFDKRISKKALLLFFAFPTAYYLGAIYSESLFFTLVLVCLILLRKHKFFWAGVVAALASATRLFGVILTLVILIELIVYTREKRISFFDKQNLLNILGVCVAPLGLLVYMLYLYFNFNDPIYFLTAQSKFGAQRSSAPFILLPQVIFRYIKMLFTVNIQNPAFFIALIEFFSTVLPLGVLILTFRKIRFSYWIFIFICLIIPTMTGTLSSMPRYSLISFLLFPFAVVYLKKFYVIILVLFIIVQIILVSKFIQGFWVS